MSETQPVPAVPQVKAREPQPTNLTVREVIKLLVDVSDADAEVCFNFHNSDPIPVTYVEENDEGQVILGSG